jgi:hypothetical protein
MRFHAENKIEIRALDEYLVEELTSTLGLSAPGAAAAQLRSCGHVCGRSTIGRYVMSASPRFRRRQARRRGCLGFDQ